jgi:4-methyl-5(b-hydroxyethyl)-thiazole monophosphate biosynthesis
MPGTINLENNTTVQNFIDYCADNGKMIAAICAAPSVLGHKGLLDNKNATCFPGFESALGNAVVSDKFAVRDGNIITAKGAGAASEFAFEIIAYLDSREKADSIRKTVQTCY